MTAIRGVFSDFKLVKTRSCAQLVIEVPIELADSVLKALGGLPQPAKERWVGIAPLYPPQDTPEPAPLAKEPWEDDGCPNDDGPGDPPRVVPFKDLKPSTQAALKCGDPDFQAWMTKTKVRPRGYEGHPFDSATCAEFVRGFCGVTSRALLDRHPGAAVLWRELLGQYEDYRLGRR